MTNGARITILCLAVTLAFGAGWFGRPIAAPVEAVKAETAKGPSWVTVGGQKIPVYPGDELDLTIQTDKTQRDVAILTGGSGEAKGGWAHRSGGFLNETLNLTPPEIDLSANGGSSGGAVTTTARGLVSHGPTMVVFAGILLVVGGIVASKWIGATGWWVAGAGAALLLCGLLFGLYPWLALLIPAVGVGLVVYYIIRARKTAKTQTALGAVVQGVQALKDDSVKTYEAVKASVAEAAGSDNDTVKAVVSQYK